MTFSIGFRRFASAAAAAAFLVSTPVFAQEVSETQLKAARAAVDALNMTDTFDTILPTIATQIKTDLIQRNPDMEALIIQTVDEETLAMAGRRGDLEKEIANVYAKSFSEAELKAIGDFYNSDAGKKLLDQGPIAMTQTQQAVEIWQRGIMRDLGQSVGEKLQKVVGAMAPAPGAEPVTPDAAGGATEEKPAEGQ
ncbi:MAG TPA: DUF2059 domain-containing protein [Rhizobiaceae bacterium]|nr:DUF2059 domain-containing protein [Rhizobiaceae bacterium]